MPLGPGLTSGSWPRVEFEFELVLELEFESTPLALNQDRDRERGQVRTGIAAWSLLSMAVLLTVSM